MKNKSTKERTAIEALLLRGLRVSLAESCTGGLIAKRLTDIAGSSGAVYGGCVTYTNEAKMQLLGVRADTLDKYGAVSEPVAKEMARGIRVRTGTEIGVSVTGLAGPGGGSAECPVGTVYVGISTSRGEQVQRLQLPPARPRSYIRTVAATRAIELILQAAVDLADENTGNSAPV